MTRSDVLLVPIDAEHDVFVVRQRGREVAAAVGLEGQDQIRVATALSDVGRQMYAHLGPVVVTFTVIDDGTPALYVSAAAAAPDSPGTLDDLTAEVAISQRLMDHWQIEHVDRRVTITMGRRLPASATPLDVARLVALRAELTRLTQNRPVEEFVLQNQQLLATLAQVQAHRDELLRLNSELEETNRGVLALYNQLNDEMEATNRGVVALYAELDDTSAQLRDANEAKSRFMANVSHELRAPVTAILGLIRLVSDPGSDPLTGEQRQQIDLIRDSADDMFTRVNELLDLAKAESGRLEPAIGPVDLAALFGTLRGTMRALAIAPDLDVIVTDPDGIGPLYTDEVLLMQILRNLMTNGIKFTPRGEVRLSVELLGTDRLQFVVSDTGVGIAADEQERVFEEFYQVRGRSQATAPGTGLGLPYARRLTELLGGELTLTSTVGAGSTFTVTMPLRPDEA